MATLDELTRIVADHEAAFAAALAERRRRVGAGARAAALDGAAHRLDRPASPAGWPS